MSADKAWTWRYERADGSICPDPSLPDLPSGFAVQVEAETWLGDSWKQLLDAGVDAVSLFAHGNLEYGPMSLHPPA
ncbi:MAG: hypothetical protein WAO41_10620 [Candidatus Nanopelagicales bacterium]